MMRWKTVPLEAVANVVNGFSFKSGDFSASNNIQSVKITNVGVQEFVEETDSLLPNNFTEKYASYQVSSGDIVIALTRTLISTGLKVAIVPVSFDKALLNQRVAAIKTSPDLLNDRFLYYFFASKTAYDFVKSSVNELMQPNLSIKDLKNFSIPFPPIEEQKSIIAILDKAFADIDQARATAERNLKNARELFDSYLQQVFSQRGEGWVKRVMSDICDITSKLIDPRDDEYLDMPHIGAGNMITGTGELLDVKTAREEKLISGKFVFDDSMVLYSKIRPYLMKVCRPDFIGLCSADVYPLSPIEGMLDKDYLFYLLLSKDFTDYAISGSGRAGMPKVNRTHLFNYEISVPCIEKQREYVGKLDEIAEQSQLLERIYNSKINKLDELKKSILQKAFTGELTKSKGIAA
jgi:type I restriction enzyme S subunit